MDFFSRPYAFMRDLQNRSAKQFVSSVSRDPAGMFNLRRRFREFLRQTIEQAVTQAIAPPDYRPARILMDDHAHRRTQELKLPVAADGSPLPWYTYPAIEYFNRLHALGLRVFEYGSGNSSLYWANKGAQVWSVEHDAAWHQTMSKRAAALQDLLLREAPEAYANAIHSVGGDFDIIIIDGAWRNECAASALLRLRQGGVLILDNSDWYTDVSDFLRSKGFLQIDFSGLGPINDYCWTTSLLVQTSAVISGRVGHPKPIGGIDVYKADKW